MYNFNGYEHAESDEIQRRMRELDVHSSTFLRSPPPTNDPITSLLTVFYSSLGFTGSIFGVSTASLLATATSALVTTAISIGINALLNPQRSVQTPSPEDGKVPLQQARPFRQWVVGRTRVAGAYMLWEASGNKLCSVQAVAGHKIRSFNRFFLHDDEVTLTGNWVDGLSDLRYGGQNVWIDYRYGEDVETYYDRISTYLGSDVWSSSHRGDGQASIAMAALSVKAENQLTYFPYGAPKLSVEVDGAYVYDPRDNTQSPTDKSTWKWSKNAALVMLWHQCFNEFGHKRDYNKAILPVVDIWIEEANVCDESIPTAGGGTEKRYEVGGFDTAENDPKVATNAILAACDGWLCERGDGALLFRVGKFRESLVETLSDQDIIGYQLQHDVLPEEEINRLVPKFAYPATNYATSDTDYFEDVDRQLTAGRVLSQDASYMWCQQWRQARRLGKRDWLRIQERKKGTINVRLSGINAIYSRWIRLNSPLALPSLDGLLIENRRSILAITSGGFAMDFIKHPSDIDAWNPATDEGTQPPVPPAPNPAGLSSPVIYSAVAQASSGSVYLAVKLVDPSDSSLSAAIRYRLADAGGGAPGDWVQKNFGSFSASGGYVSLSTDVVPANKSLEVQAAWITTTGKFSNWSSTDTVFSTADPTPPGDVYNLSVITGVAGEATINWNAPNSANYAGAKIFYNTVNNSSTATFSGPLISGVPNGSYSKTITRPAGTYYGWVQSVNASGVAGNMIPTGAFTVS